MGAGELRPVRAELLHESDRTRVTRLFLPGTSVVRKEPLGPDADRRLQHELAILQRLRGVAGVAQLVEAPRFPGSIVMADEGGRSVSGLAEGLLHDLLQVRSAARVSIGEHDVPLRLLPPMRRRSTPRSTHCAPPPCSGSTRPACRCST